MNATDVLNEALDALDTGQQRMATHILLGYLWSASSAETREAALAAMQRHVR